jgi:2-pyrone-4,6-dicarboxylate lactonase
MLETRPETTCLSPRPPSRATKCDVPANAWDCHVHVCGPSSEYPYIQRRHYTPNPAPPTELFAALDIAGIRHAVAVQMSIYGTDNRYLLKALRRHPERLRAIAVVDVDTPDRQILELKEAGVVGIRLLEADGGVGTSNIEYFDGLCFELGWHMQVCIRSSRYLELLPTLSKLRARLVIDHMGWPDLGNSIADARFQAVLSLLRSSQNWVKVSGAFRLSTIGPPYLDVVPYIRQLCEAAAGRVVWGSDWPHVGLFDEERVPRYGSLLDLLVDSELTMDEIDQMLVENPKKLYRAKS